MSKRFSIVLLALLASCYSHTHITDFSGVPGLRGEPIEYQATTSYSLNLFYIFSLFGNTNLESTIEAFAEEASSRGATRLHITQTTSEVYWYIFLPFTFIIQPVVSTVEGTVEGTVSFSE